jgi:serine/threonine protein kinase
MSISLNLNYPPPPQHYFASTEEALESNDEKIFKEFIQKILGENYKIDSVKKLSSSSRIVFEINDSLIICFSTDGDKIKQEGAILRSLLAHKPNIQVPEYSNIYWLQGKQISYVLYPKIPGEDLTAKKFHELSELEVNNLAEDLASFLVKMHSIPSVKDLLPLETDEKLGGLMPRVPPPFLLNEKMESYLKNSEYIDLLPLWRQVHALYLTVYDNPKLKAPIHNDLHASNLLIDPVSKHLSGIIDFEDAVFGHVSRDFRHFYSIDPKFMIKIAENYAKKSNFDEADFIQSAFVFRMYREFTNLWKVIEFPQIANEGDKKSADILRGFLRSEYISLFFS